MKSLLRKIYLLSIFVSSSLLAQDYGDLTIIEKDLLQRDLELLYQGLNEFHSGMYWYTPKDSVDAAFEKAKEMIDRDMNVLEFHKIIAPLVGLSREDHTDIHLPYEVEEIVKEEAKLLPFIPVFLGQELYCVKNGASDDTKIEGKKIVSINGISPNELVEKMGSLFASDGYIKRVKYSDLSGFNFNRYFFYYFGNQERFDVVFEDSEISFNSLKYADIIDNLESRYPRKESQPDECLEFKMINDKVAYIGLHDFSNETIKENEVNSNLKEFLDNSFAEIGAKKIENLIIDVSENTGGTEGNENLVYSYVGDNYQKYLKVRAKAQKAILDNGIDIPIQVSTFGFFERVFVNKKMSDGSYERKKNVGIGIEAYSKEPNYRFTGNAYVIIHPVTYSGGSEFANMMATTDRATFVGQETGGGYYGNTSGYSPGLPLPHSGIEVDLPALQFMMNVQDKYPKGRGVIPDYEVIPTIEQYMNGEDVEVEFILDLIEQTNNK